MILFLLSLLSHGQWCTLLSDENRIQRLVFLIKGNPVFYTSDLGSWTVLICQYVVVAELLSTR